MSDEDLRPWAPAAGSSEPKFDAGEVTAALERMLASPSFARSLRLQALLRYIVAERLAGREDSPKEYELGTRVFERPDAFDPQADPIVRVQARQLRFKLREYYESSGAEERLRIDLPKGSYLPAFRYQPGPTTAAAEPATRTESRDDEGRERAVPDRPASDSENASETVRVAPAPQHGLGTRWMIWLLIACALPLLLLGIRRQVAPPPVVPYKPDAKARTLYLEGRYYWNQRRPDSLHKAVEDFTQATVEDPNYAQAYVGLADSYNLLHEFAAMPAKEAYARATKAAQRAVELEPESAAAHSSLAFDLFWGAWDATGSEREFQRALQLDPNYVRAHHWYGTSLMAEGRLNEALAEMERARELDPTSPSVFADYALVLYDLGRREEAVALLHTLETNDPSFISPHHYLSMIGECTGDVQTFVEESQKQAILSENPVTEAVAEAAEEGFRSGGERGMLLEVLRAQTRAFDAGQGTAYSVAETSALLGRPQDAIRFLRKAYDRRESEMMALPTECTLRSLDKEPGFRSLLARMQKISRGGYAADSH